MKKYSLLWVSALLPVLLAATAWADFKAGFEALKKRDYPAALREWRPLAEHGDHRAQAALGLMYYEGEGVEKDYKTAAHWLRKSADQGFAPAQAYLGLMYGKGRGSPDFKKAVYWYQRPLNRAMPRPNSTWLIFMPTAREYARTMSKRTCGWNWQPDKVGPIGTSEGLVPWWPTK